MSSAFVWCPKLPDEGLSWNRASRVFIVLNLWRNLHWVSSYLISYIYIFYLSKGRGDATWRGDVATCGQLRVGVEGKKGCNRAEIWTCNRSHFWTPTTCILKGNFKLAAVFELPRRAYFQWGVCSQELLQWLQSDYSCTFNSHSRASSPLCGMYSHCCDFVEVLISSLFNFNILLDFVFYFH